MFRRIVTGVTLGVAVCGLVGVTDGCLTRPVAATKPVTKTNFITSVPQGSIDKVDLLFDIDNSASMGDKQAYLSQAIPDLIGRLVAPNCLDDVTSAVTGPADLNGNCTAAGSSAEFPPVHNMHIGIVSSSLGERLGGADTCDPTATQALAGGATIPRHNDDQGHLLNRTGNAKMLTDYTEGTSGPATDNAPGGDNFLDWFPTVMANANATATGPTAETNANTLQTDFASLVVGTHEFGCGIESQLESWYRFLIQPDPYGSLTTDTNGHAQWVGVDTTILAQRADFLRPDSLVAILVLTDENDSEVDVRSFGGSAWHFMDAHFNPPRGTSACLSGNASMVNSSACTSCAFPGVSDSNCKVNVPSGGSYGVYSAATDWGMDLNLRHVHEQQKYGASVQFPIDRYVLGLTSTTVPNRDGEYVPDGKGGYSSSYQGLKNLNCTNPLFASALPKPPTSNLASWNPTSDELCKLPQGTRNPNLVFYAHIGGVPHELLQVDPSKTDTASQSQKAALTDADWQLILGKDPENYDYTGIDPHMVESYQPRTAVPVPAGGFPVADSSQPEGSDPIAGREWTTDSTMPEHNGLLVDREYACIFKLPAPGRDCSATAVGVDPTLNASCDCLAPAAAGQTFSHAQLPAVCNDSKNTTQDYAKTYPTVRELLLAKKLGAQGIISSLCPIHTTDQSSDGMSDPLFGYRPAMNAIIAKLSAVLSHTCLPQKLTIAPDPTSGNPQVSCLVLGTFAPGSSSPPTCAAANLPNTPAGQGYVDPDPTVLAHFKTDLHGQFVQGGGTDPTKDPSNFLTCELSQLPPNVHCDTGSADGWCYIDDGSVKGCSQAILFNKLSVVAGVTTSLQCIEASGSDSGI